VAESYAKRFFDELSRKQFDRELLERFADECPRGRVLDVGCGPGHVGRFLRDLDVDVTGVDLSPSMVDVARRLNEGMRFEVGEIHIARESVPAVLLEFHRVIARGGRLLLAVHGGRGSITSDEFLGHPVRFEATLFELQELKELIEAAGFTVDEALRRAPYEFEAQTLRLYLAATRR
jgi:SAM-dependent methyltransferase